VQFEATDNFKVETQGYVWSEGALDVRGRLTEGTHTLTLFAEDRSGNRTEKTIAYYVTETGDPEDNVVDEEEACKPVEPEIPDVSEEPDVPATSEEPVEPPVSEEPSVPATSEEPVEPPVSEEPDVPATSEPTTSAPETESKKKGGCGGFTAIGTMAAMALAGVALLKKKEE
jgi:outer membrane biosynthesis protein TonB